MKISRPISTLLLAYLFSSFISISYSQTIFTESMGSPSGTTSIASFESANGFDNDPYSMTGTGDLRTTAASTGYIGATGAGNVFLTNNGTANFQISGISTTGCTSLILSFGAYKSTIASNMSELLLEYSIDGATYNPVTFSLQPTGSGTSNWRLITVSLPSVAGNQANLRLRWTNTSTTPQFRIDDITLSGSCSVSNTITTSTLFTPPFSISCETGQTGSVDFTSTGTFNPGNEFIVQLSNSSGSFSSPTDIGSLDSTSSVGTSISNSINFSIPGGLTSGTYSIRVISTSPSITGSTSSSFSITLTNGPCTLVPPHITSIIINSCNPTCPEGHNELIFGTTGDYSVNVTNSNFNFSYGSTYPLTNYTDILTINSTTTANINTAAGCAGTYIDGTGLTLPPGSSFILAPTQLCIDALTWSGLCSLGPIYMIYQNDANWNLNGTFKNGNTGGIRYFNSTFTTTSAETFSIDYNYNSTLLQSGTAGDGDYVLFGPNGGSAIYGDNDCVLTPILLPTSSVELYVENTGESNTVLWTTSSELNNDHFNIHHSVDGLSFEAIGQVQGAGNSSSELTYLFVHHRPKAGINYYKLTSTDYNGTTYNKGITSVMVSSEGSYFDPISSSLIFAQNGDYQVLSPEGKIVGQVTNENRFQINAKGIILVRDLRSGTIERLFIP
jgi:hypothetical protein